MLAHVMILQLCHTVKIVEVVGFIHEVLEKRTGPDLCIAWTVYRIAVWLRLILTDGLLRNLC